MLTQQPGRSRAPRLDPDARRASILEAATELFAERGAGFTTAELARAAAVSEATIFRYFPDKASLMEATRDAVLGLPILLPQLEAARELPTLIQRLAAAAHALNPCIERTARVLENTDVSEHPGNDSIRELVAALAPLFGDDGHAGLAPEQLAGMFLGSMLANTTMSAKTGVKPIGIDRLVDLVLHGVAPRPT